MLTVILSALITDEARDRFTLVYNKYHKPMIRMALDYVSERQDAEDIVHSVFCTVAEQWTRLEPRGDEGIRRFLFVCLRNRTISFVRKKSRLVSYEELAEKGVLDHADANGPSIEEAAVLEETMTALRSLDTRTGDAIWMMTQGYTTAETARIFNEKTETIKKRVQRGRKKLKAILGPEWEDDL